MKRLSVFLLCLCLFGCSASAAEPVPLEDDAASYAEAFAETVSGEDLNVSDTVPVEDVSGKTVGYAVSFEKNGTDWGYVQLDLRLLEPVSSFALSEGQAGLYEQAAEAAFNGVMPQGDVSLVEVSPFSYGLRTVDGLLHTEERVYSEKEQKRAARKSSETGLSWQEAFEDTYSGTVTEEAKLSVYDKEKSFLSQDYVGRIVGRYACAVTAMTEVMNQNDYLLNNSIKDTYDDLWIRSITSAYDGDGDGVTDRVTASDGTEYYLGSTRNKNILGAMQLYLNAMNVEYRSNRYYNPTFDDLVHCVDKDCFGLIYAASVYDADGDVNGHAVNVLGYLVTEDDDAETEYLFAADGWGETGRYLNLERFNYTPDNQTLVWFADIE